MMCFHADVVDLPEEELLQYGEGWLSFEWADRAFGKGGFEFDEGGFCTRSGPPRGGRGSITVVTLSRDRLRFRLQPELAQGLELDEEFEISFSISDEEYIQLRRIFEEFWGYQINLGLP